MSEKKEIIMQEIRLLKKLSVILALLVVGYVALVMYDKSTTEEVVTEQVVAICDIHVSEIKALALKNSHGAFGLLVGQGGNISLEPNKDKSRYSLAEMQGFIYLISKMSSLRVLDKYNSISDFGLSEPSSVVTIIKSDGTKSRFLLGNASDANGSHYLMKEGGKDIFVVASDTVRLLQRSKEDFTERELIPALGVDGLERLSMLTISAKGRADRAYTIDNLGGYHFKLTAPIVNSLSTERVFSDIMLPLTSLYPDAISEVGNVFEDGESDYELTVVIDGKTYNLLFVKKDSKSYYVKNNLSSTVFEIPAERVAFMNMDYLELLSGAIYSCNVSRIESVIFEDLKSNTDSTLYISGVGDEVQGEINGYTIKYKKLMPFINSLNTIAMSEEVSVVHDLPVPYYTITVNKPDGQRDYLEFIEAGKSQSYLRVNGVINFKVYTKIIENISSELAVLTGEKKN